MTEIKKEREKKYVILTFINKIKNLETGLKKFGNSLQTIILSPNKQNLGIHIHSYFS